MFNSFSTEISTYFKIHAGVINILSLISFAAIAFLLLRELRSDIKSIGKEEFIRNITIKDILLSIFFTIFVVMTCYIISFVLVFITNELPLFWIFIVLLVLLFGIDVAKEESNVVYKFLNKRPFVNYKVNNASKDLSEKNKEDTEKNVNNEITEETSVVAKNATTVAKNTTVKKSTKRATKKKTTSKKDKVEK